MSFLCLSSGHTREAAAHEHYDTVTVVLSSNNNNFHQPTLIKILGEKMEI